MSADKAKPVELRSFSETQWQGIKASLADRGVDLDACTVGTFVPGKARWWLVDDSDAQTKERVIEVNGEIVPQPRKEPLRDALQAMAYYYDSAFHDDTFFRKKLRTPIQQAQDLEETLIALDNALTILDRTGIDDDGAATDQMVARSNVAYGALAQCIDDLKERIAELRAVGRAGNQNARTRHNDYWHELTRLWLGITGSVGPKRRRRLRSFLSACTPPTMFSDMTARRLSEKLGSFVNNCFR